MLLVTCDVTGYNGIDIKDIINQKSNPRPSVYVMFDENPKNGKDLEKTVTNAQIQRILDKIDNMEYFQNIEFDDNRIPDKSNEYSKSRAFMRKGKPSSSDSSVSSNSSSSSDETNPDPKRTLSNLVRRPKHNASENRDKTDKTLGSPYSHVSNTDVIKKNITLRFGGSCNKGASKSCVTACKGVLKNVCHEYKCSSGMKNRFKHECKTNCRKRFNINS